MQNTLGRILIIEDNEDFRHLAVVSLAERGHYVAAAADGKEALDYLRNEEKPDLIVLDLQMPRMCGTEFRRVQLEDPNIKAIPTYLYSSVINPEAMAEELGCDGYIPKGLIGDLIQTVEGRLGTA